MGYNLKRLDPEIVKRHIAILELKESGLGYGAIGRKLSLKIGTVSNTINNHGGKLAELREVLRQFEKSIGESGFGSVVVAKANQNGSKVEVATSNQEEIVGVEQVNRSDQEQVKLWTNLLKSICFNGFSMTKEWQVEMVEKLGLASTDELVEMLEMLAERGYLVKYEVEVEGEERDVFYQVSFDGRPYAKGEEIIEVCINNGEDGSNLVEEAVRDTVPKGESADPEVDLFRFLSQININGSLRIIIYIVIIICPSIKELF
jgi:DNA-binding Lrp family transcriptional regulator